MVAAVVPLLLGAAAAVAPPRVFEIQGRLEPATTATVALHGATTPFAASAVAGINGQFRFRKLPSGTYTIVIGLTSRGEVRQTVEVGPGTADRKGRVNVAISLAEDRLQNEAAARGAIVSRTELAIPKKAVRDYEAAQKLLQRPDVTGAERRLESAVAVAPGFAAAWNTLGTICYQTRRYTKAEECFRKALEADPGAYEPLVNLGGVLLTLNKIAGALDYNLRAVLRRPTDALANSQMGMSYFAVQKWDLAEKYLAEAVRLDPAHFSQPQMLLAEVHFRKGMPEKAAADLENFLTHHPDDPKAPRIREAIARLRGAVQ
jgi:tetratricopeptide (TPR) repeat protein